nr:BTAD domain-containing putative transcriptional regulator [Nocardioides thalensis]
MLVGVLGPASVIPAEGEPVEIAARRQAEVLAVLAAHRGRQVSAETIADLVWRGAPPSSAAVTLQGYVSRLRQVLEPDRALRGAGTALVTTGDGYRLGLETDVDRFEAAVAEAREIARERPLAAAELLARALDLWRGPAYADVRDLADLAPEVERVDEMHAVAQELRGQALLDAGKDAEVVPELRRMVVEHPLRERTHALLAIALFRSGRQADALAVLRELRERLVDELGVDPGPDIAELEQRLLKQDPGLMPRRPVGAATTSAADGFAGREAELAALDAAFRRAADGQLATAVVRGEPGIGKTTLVQRFTTGAPRAAGADVRWGRCPAAAGAPAYWPWVQVLGGLPDVDGDRESARFALGLDLARRLEELAGERGGVVVLDDAQWADADSLVVLEVALEALASARLLLVLTARDEEPRAPEELDRVLGALARRPGHLDLRLAGLTADEAAGLLVGTAPEQAQRLVERAGGNPFFLRSLAALDAGAGVPDSVRDTVRRRIGALPAGGAELMDVLALASRDVPLAVVASAVGLSLDGLEEPLAAALRAGLLEEPGPGRLRVAHDIVRESVESALTPVARRDLHRRLADAFASLGLDAGAVVAEHRLAAASGERDDVAARAALAAASDALASAALGEARDLARRGLAATEESEIRSGLLRVAGVAARRLGHLEESERDFRAAAEIARADDDWVRFAEIALESAPGGVGGFWALFALPFLGASPLLSEALARLDDVPAALSARLLAASATLDAGNGTPGARELAERALTEADGDRDARARALIAWVIATWTPDQAEARLAAIEELLTLAAHDAALEATAHHLHRSVLLELGRTADHARAVRAFDAVVARERDPDLQLLDTWWQVGRLVSCGDRDRARQLAAEAEWASTTVSPLAAAVDRASRATIDGIAAWHDGRLIDAVPEAMDLAADVDPDFLLVVALAHAEAGNREVAIPAIDRLLAAPAEGHRLVPRTLMLSEALVALGDGERLAGLVPVLRSWGDRIVVQLPGDICMGPAALYLGSALAVVGERAEARRLLEQAVTQAEAVGVTPYAERARRRLAAL